MDYIKKITRSDIHDIQEQIQLLYPSLDLNLFENFNELTIENLKSIVNELPCITENEFNKTNFSNSLFDCIYNKDTKKIQLIEKSRKTGKDKKDPEHDISIRDIDPTTYPMIAAARNKFPTARNDLEALVKLIQYQMDVERKEIRRLDKVNDREDKDIEHHAKELRIDDKEILANRKTINDILSRLRSLEANQQELSHTVVQSSLKTEGYDFIKEPISEVERNTLKKNDWRGYTLSRYENILANAEKVTTIDGYEVWIRDFSPKVKIIDLLYKHPKGEKFDKIVGEIELVKYRNPNYWQADYTTIDPSLRGRNMALKLYTFLMKEMNFVIVSGESHSVGAEKLWKRIVQNPKIYSWIEKPNGEKQELFYDEEQNELNAVIDPYTSEYNEKNELRSELEQLQDFTKEDIEKLKSKLKHKKITKQEFNKQQKKIRKMYDVQKERIQKKYNYEIKQEQISKNSMFFAMWKKKDTVTEVDTNNIRKDYWLEKKKSIEPIFNEYRERDELSNLGSYGDVDLWLHFGKNKDFSVFLTHKHELVGWISLDSFSTPNYFQTSIAVVDKKYQGNNIIYKIYLMMMREMKLILVSSNSHSPGARKLWEKIIKNKNIIAWVQHDDEKHQIIYDPKEKEFSTSLDPYVDRLEFRQSLDDLYNELQILSIQFVGFKKELDQKLMNKEITKQEYDTEYQKASNEYTQKTKKYESLLNLETDISWKNEGSLIYAMWDFKVDESYKFIRQNINEIETNKIPKDMPYDLYKRLFKKANDEDNLKEIGLYDNFIVFWSDETKQQDTCVYLYDRINHKLACYMSVYNYIPANSKNHYVTNSVVLNPEYHGKNVAYGLYLYLMKELKWVLVSGNTHSEGAKKLWRKIVKTPGVFAYVGVPKIYDYNDRKESVHSIEYDPETDELEGFVDPYAGGEVGHEYHGPNYANIEHKNQVYNLVSKQQHELRLLGKKLADNMITQDEYKRISKEIKDSYSEQIRKLDQTYMHEIDGYQESYHARLIAFWDEDSKEINEQIKLSKADKLWIHPERGIMIPVEYHHSADAKEHPEKFGLSGKTFDDNSIYGTNEIFNINVLNVMFSEGWVRYIGSFSYHFGGFEGNFHSNNEYNIRDAIQFMRKNNNKFDTVLVTVNNEDFVLKKPLEIKNYIRKGIRPDQNQIQESKVTTEFPWSFWVNSNTGEVIHVEQEHVDEIYTNPELFGISKEDFDEITSKSGRISWNSWYNLVDRACKNGWARCGKINNVTGYFFIQTADVSTVLKVARIIDKIQPIEYLLYDTSVEEIILANYKELKGQELRTFLKTGKLIKNRVAQFMESAKIDFDKYGSWINPKQDLVLPVEFQKHEQTIKKQGTTGYVDAYKKGWVRLEHDSSYSMSIDGTEENVYLVMRYYLRDYIRIVRSVYLTLHNSEGVYIADKKFYFDEPSGMRKYNEFMQELRTGEKLSETKISLKEQEQIDTDEYGSWVHPDLDIVLSVPKYKHSEVILTYDKNLHTMYNAYHRGWVRLMHNPYELNIEGNFSNIVKVLKRYFKNIEKNFTIVLVDILDKEYFSRLVMSNRRDVQILNAIRAGKLPSEKNVLSLTEGFIDNIDFSTYGGWINSETKTYLPVDHQTHKQTIKSYDPELPDYYEYEAAYSKNWVRLVYSKISIDIEGNLKDILKVLNTSLRNLEKQFKFVGIDVVDHNIPGKIYDLTFINHLRKFNSFKKTGLLESVGDRQEVDISKYGSWINPTLNKILPVPFESHIQTIGMYDDSVFMYDQAYAKDWVKLTHPEKNRELSIRGKKVNVIKVLKRYFRRIENSFDTVIVEFINNTSILDFHKFNLLDTTELRGLYKLINGITESLMEYKGKPVDFGNYGTWINPELHEVVPVTEYQRHIATMIKRDDHVYTYAELFSKHWVRLTHNVSTAYEIAIEGNLVDVIKVLKTYLRGIDKHFNTLEIDIVGGGSNLFTLSNNAGKRDLVNFLKQQSKVIDEGYKFLSDATRVGKYHAKKDLKDLDITAPKNSDLYVHVNDKKHENYQKNFYQKWGNLMNQHNVLINNKPINIEYAYELKDILERTNWDDSYYSSQLNAEGKMFFQKYFPQIKKEFQGILKSKKMSMNSDRAYEYYKKHALRSGINPDDYISIMRWLTHYTSMSNRKIPKEVLDVLQKISVIPSEVQGLTVYRGIFYDGDKIKNQEQWANTWYPGSKPKIKSSKPTSWSTSKAVAIEFLDPQDKIKNKKDGYSVLLSYNIKDPSVVLADLRNFPKSKFWSQQEIILSNNAIDYEVEKVIPYQNYYDLKMKYSDTQLYKFRKKHEKFFHGAQGYTDSELLSLAFFDINDLDIPKDIKLKWKTYKDMSAKEVKKETNMKQHWNDKLESTVEEMIFPMYMFLKTFDIYPFFSYPIKVINKNTSIFTITITFDESKKDERYELFTDIIKDKKLKDKMSNIQVRFDVYLELKENNYNKFVFKVYNIHNLQCGFKPNIWDDENKLQFTDSPIAEKIYNAIKTPGEYQNRLFNLFKENVNSYVAKHKNINVYMESKDYSFIRSDQFGVKTPTIEEIAKKHNVSLEELNKELQLGIEVEKEHTNDETLANEIARDHLNEFPDYYTRLKKVEK